MDDGCDAVGPSLQSFSSDVQAVVNLDIDMHDNEKVETFPVELPTISPDRLEDNLDSSAVHERPVTLQDFEDLFEAMRDEIRQSLRANASSASSNK